MAIRSDVTRRSFLQASAAGASVGAAAQGPSRPAPSHRTQFDAQLLAESHDLLVASNNGRQMQVSPGGAVRCALAWGGAEPRLRTWVNYEAGPEVRLAGPPSAPVWIGEQLWISAGESVLADGRPIAGLQGRLLDGVSSPDGTKWLAVARGSSIAIVSPGSPSIFTDDDAGSASLDAGEGGRLHLVYEKQQGLEYRVFEGARIVHAERVAEAYAFQPVILSHNGGVVLAYLGESCRLPSVKPGSEAWERLGRGGYIAALTRDETGRWVRRRLADSREVTKALYPIDGAYGGGDNRPLRSRMEEFGAPALTVGADGVVQVLWCNTVRRWIYGARLIGDTFAATGEARGPLEQLEGICLAPRSVPPELGANPLAMVTRTRVYLDRIALPTATVSSGRRIDFLTPDELAGARGIDVRVNQMQRRPENPVIPLDPVGGTYDSAIVPNVMRDGTKWRADLMYIVRSKADPNTSDRGWRSDGLAVSDDGIRWTKLPPVALERRFQGAATKYTVRFIEDPSDKNSAWRYKGLMRSPEHEPWGYIAVTSADSVRWIRVDDAAAIVRADDDLRITFDPDDLPQRRFKANAIGRSFCGRTAVQYTSPDGVHWNDVRDTLDFDDPFGARPDRGSTGRILLDSWSGPEDEDEIHGGYVFRDGNRWLLHYMKWTPDGHIYCALAASRDGLNYSRVGGGAVTLGLGEPGAWDGGRVALREAPFRVGDVWRQYYTGCGWKHGLGGVGAKTSHYGLNAPNQVGAAEIPAGRWAHIEVSRDFDAGEIVTVPLRLLRPHRLHVDAGGLDAPGSRISAAVLDASTRRALPGFDHDSFTTWRNKRIDAAQPVRIAVRLSGHRVKLYGIDLIA